MHFNFDPTLQDTVGPRRASSRPRPAWSTSSTRSQAKGYAVFGITGRSDEPGGRRPLANLTKVGYTAFNADNFFTKWSTARTPTAGLPRLHSVSTRRRQPSARRSSTRPAPASTSSRPSATTSSSTSATSGPTCRAGTPTTALKLPNPTYYLPSPDLTAPRRPSRRSPRAPRSRWRPTAPAARPRAARASRTSTR